MSKRAWMLLPGLFATACAHTPAGLRQGTAVRVGVVVIDEGYVDKPEGAQAPLPPAPKSSAAPDPKQQQAAEQGQRQEDLPYTWDPECRKRYLTRYTRLRQDEATRTRFTWILTNSCDVPPRGCRPDSNIELVFNQWQYTREILEPGQAGTYPPPNPRFSPFEERCQQPTRIWRDTAVPLTCTFKEKPDVGSYRFQAVLMCDGRAVDNWDPEIIVDKPRSPGPAPNP